jgi:hypothetical protein
MNLQFEYSLHFAMHFAAVLAEVSVAKELPKGEQYHF